MAHTDIPTIRLFLTYKEAEHLVNILSLYSPNLFDYCNAKGMPGANEISDILFALESAGVRMTVAHDPPPMA